MLNRYIHGTSAGDDPVAMYAGSSVALSNARFLYRDRLGSVVMSGDINGGNVQTYGYDEFGVHGTTSPARFGYTGQVYVPEAGLYYYKARMYSPGLGRFMQTDPIGYADGPNMYAYVGNDPVNAVDPLGLAKDDMKVCTGSRIRRGSNYDCNAMFAGTGPQSSTTDSIAAASLGFDATLTAGGGGAIVVTGTRRLGVPAPLITDHMITVYGAPQLGGVLRNEVQNHALGSVGPSYLTLLGLGPDGGDLAVYVSSSIVRERAKELVKRVGKNRVVIRTQNGRIVYDLAGRVHFSKRWDAVIPTPHVLVESLHIGPNGRGRYKTDSIRPMRMTDIRVLESRFSQ